MGAWGPNALENDQALDWLYEAGERGYAAPVKQAFGEVLGADEGAYVEADLGEVALAAAEVVAIARGRSREVESLEYVAQITAASAQILGVPDVVSAALRAMDRVAGTNSELQELWNEGGENVEWANAMSDLRARLS
jgi:uncharacterized protein DUF4259